MNRCVPAAVVIGLALSTHVAEAESPTAAKTPDRPVGMQRVPASQFEGCLPPELPAYPAKASVMVTATIAPDGKAGNLRFPEVTEPWLRSAAECVMQEVEFTAATRDGSQVAADVIVPIDFQRDPAAAPITSSVTPPRMKPGDTKQLSACYARSARRAGAEGVVDVTLTVGIDGSVSDYELPAGIERWQEVTARCIVEQLTFEPAKRNGIPFVAKTKFPLSFSIEGNDPLTLAKPAASDADMAAALRSCYPPGGQASASPEYRVTVNVRGWPSQVLLVKSSGDKALDSAGACVLRKLRYEPARRGERPVMSTVLLPVALQPPK
jgi:outer membrane biosynthesis protein TonB